MRIRMLRDDMGADDGIHAKLYEAGEVYDLGPVLSECYLAEGIAEKEDAAAPPDPVVAPPVSTRHDLPLKVEPDKRAVAAPRKRKR